MWARISCKLNWNNRWCEGSFLGRPICAKIVMHWQQSWTMLLQTRHKLFLGCESGWQPLSFAMSRRGVFTLCDRACGVPANESQAQQYYDRTQGPLGGPHRELEAGSVGEVIRGRQAIWSRETMCSIYAVMFAQAHTQVRGTHTCRLLSMDCNTNEHDAYSAVC